MCKNLTESSNLINSKTLGIMAIFAASVLVTGALIAAPSYAKGDGNTITDFKNKGEAKAGGYGSFAFNAQSNCLTVYSYPCIEVGSEK